MGEDWANGQVAVDDRTNVELAVVSPSMTNPTNIEADAALPNKDLKNHWSNILTENKTLVSELEPAFFLPLNLGKFDRDLVKSLVSFFRIFAVYYSSSFVSPVALAQEAVDDTFTS